MPGRGVYSVTQNKAIQNMKNRAAGNEMLCTKYGVRPAGLRMKRTRWKETQGRQGCTSTSEKVAGAVTRGAGSTNETVIS